MRRPLLAGNWKMHHAPAAGRKLAKELVNGLRGVRTDADVLVCPPFPSLAAVGEALSGSGILLGAQDLHPEEKGAFTGDVSGPMLREAGCAYVLVGHSERRALHAEDDALVGRKLLAALSAGLLPVVCVGETLEERESGRTEAVLARQLEGALAGDVDPARIAVAYEPVWAIGTGKTATPETAQAAHAFARGRLAERFGREAADGIRLLYGGSVKPDNAAALLSQADVDGALVGGASLTSEQFLPIVKAAASGR